MKAIPTRPDSLAARLSRPHMWLVLAATAQILMEVTLFSLWYQVMFPAIALAWGGIFGLLALIFFISYTLASLFGPRDQARRPWLWVLLRQGIFLTWMAAAIIVSLRLMVFAGMHLSLVEMLRQPNFFFTHSGLEGAGSTHIFFIALIVWRGISLAYTPATSAGLRLSFQMGLIILMIYGMSNAPTHPAEATAGLYLYLFWALVGMSAARLASLDDERSGRVPRMNLSWLVGILLTALGTVAFAIFSGWFASQRLVAWILRGVALVFAALAGVVFSLLIPLILLLARLISELMEILQRLLERISSQGVPAVLKDIAEQLGQALTKAIPVNLGSRVVVIVAIVFIVAVTLILGIRFRAYRRIAEDEDDSQSGSGEISLHLEKMLRGLLPEGLNLRLRSPVQVLAAARIRFIYRRLIALSRQRGADRPPASTPLEFLPQLCATFPAQPEAVELITAAYVRIRYGEYPETLQDVDQVQRAWDAIRKHPKK
jgi:hypothetical protein